MEKVEKKIAKVVKMECLQDTADDKMLFEKGKVYDLPFDHPCLEYFKPVTYTTDKADLGPPGVILRKEAPIAVADPEEELEEELEEETPVVEADPEEREEEGGSEDG